MGNFSKIITAAAVLATSGVPIATPAVAHTTYYAHHHRYHGRTYYAHRYCRYSNGTTGLVAGGVVGHSVLGHGLLGTAAGVVGGAVAGRAIDRSMTANRRCYYR